MIWIVLTALIGLAAAISAAPFLASSKSSPKINQRAAFYNRQIAEIDRDAASGVATESEAAALRIEAQRRLLNAAQSLEPIDHAMQKPRLFAALAIAGFVTLAGTGVYILKGSPTTPSPARTDKVRLAPLGAADTGGPALGSVDVMIEGLKARLEQSPNDAEGWRMLGWSYFNLGKNREAAEAYSHAVSLEPDNSAFQSAYGEALVLTAGGFVVPEALKAFDATLAIEPDEPRARFFKGLALDQAGGPSAAISAWVEMVNSAPPGADWVADLRRRIEARAVETGFDLAGRMTPESLPATLAAAQAGPSAEQVTAAMALPADDRQAMIEGMVARLAARLAENPDDADGWIRLIRSRMVLGRTDAARDDLRRALAAFEANPKLRERIVTEARGLGVEL